MELDLLEQELKEIEKEQIPSSHFGLWSESEGQLKEINFLRDQMTNVSDSDMFRPYEGLPSSLGSTKEELSNHDEKINKAVDRILADQANQLESLSLADGVTMNN